ncbi:MAG: hypothetical protein HXY26_09355 [Hydrogenophilaceae bacterium]|nr:hypothetical protein [Hydrogenophilaceae bacterium]
MALAVLSLCAWMTHFGMADAAEPDKGLGVNLHGVSYWSPTQPFVDVFRQSGAWVPQREGSQVWDTREPLDIDEHGWLRSLTPGQQAATVVMSGGTYPVGTYTVTYDGQGDLSFNMDARIAGRHGNDLLVEVQPKYRVIMKVLRTDPRDPIRNVRMYMPGFDPSRHQVTFNPRYLGYLKGFKVVRFVDWAKANTNNDIKWSDRTRPMHASQDRNNGVALEYMIQMAESMDANPWFTVPHAASDDYVIEMAKLIKRQLKLGRKFYLEYSNEVWNGIFPQHAYASREASRLGLRDADDYYVRRTLQVFKLFEGVFGGSRQFVRVLSGQAVNTWRAKRLLDYPDIGKQVDAYAIAPYFGHEIAEAVRGKGSHSVAVEAVMGKLESSVEGIRKIVSANMAIAKQAGVQLIAYEAGQHVTNPPGDDDFCAAINRHPAMGRLYEKYLDIWQQETAGALMVMYADVSRYDRNGCWGLSEQIGQDAKMAPKLVAVRAHLQAGK